MNIASPQNPNHQNIDMPPPNPTEDTTSTDDSGAAINNDNNSTPVRVGNRVFSCVHICYEKIILCILAIGIYLKYICSCSCCKAQQTPIASRTITQPMGRDRFKTCFDDRIPSDLDSDNIEYSDSLTASEPELTPELEPESAQERFFTAQLPTVYSDFSTDKVCEVDPRSYPLRVRGGNYAGHNSQKVYRTPEYTLEHNYTFTSRNVDDFYHIAQKQWPTFKSILDTSKSYFIRNWIVNHPTKPGNIVSFVTVHARPETFEEYRNAYALGITREEAGSDPQKELNFSRQQLSQFLCDFRERYTKEQQNKAFKTYVYLPANSASIVSGAWRTAKLINAMNRPLFTHRGVTFQDFFIGPNYIEMDINVTSATADHAGGYGLDDPSTYTDLIFSAGDQFVVQKTTIAEFETSEAVLASAQLNFIKFTEGNLIDLDSHNAEDPEDTQ